MALRARDAVPNVALYNLRDEAGLSQQEVADGLNERATRRSYGWSCTAQTVSRWERGVVERPDPVARRLLAEFFDVSIGELGFTRPRSTGERATAVPALEDVDLTLRHTCAPALDARVERSQQEWKDTRRALNTYRHALTEVAARLYEPGARLEGTGLLAPPSWILPEPIDLAEVTLQFATAPGAPALTGEEPQATPALPLESIGSRYGRYTHAIRSIDPPRLFENRLSYRLVELDWSSTIAQMSFGYTTYFEMVDVCELLAHEVALSHLRYDTDGPSVSQPSWRRLSWRKLLAGPFDLTQRALLPSIDTLTIRRAKSGSPSMIIHQRDGASVAVAGEMLHIMPAGVFQPSSVLPAAQQNDFSLWRNVMREFSEEFLGNPEHNGDGHPIAYEQTEPFATFERARRDGTLQIYCFGLALDALTLAGEILTVAVIDEDVYDTVFADLVSANTEGRVAAATVPFEEHTVRRLLTGKHHALAPAAAGCLALAWKHRDMILAR
jgi:transcriptional regulator with XRE-family HTH domain